MGRSIAPLAVLVLAATRTAVSAQTMNVQSLMSDGYTVAGVVTSPAGPGVFLQKGATRLLFILWSRSPVRHPSIRNTANQ